MHKLRLNTRLKVWCVEEHFALALEDGGRWWLENDNIQRNVMKKMFFCIFYDGRFGAVEIEENVERDIIHMVLGFDLWGRFWYLPFLGIKLSW